MPIIIRDPDNVSPGTDSEIEILEFEETVDPLIGVIGTGHHHIL